MSVASLEIRPVTPCIGAEVRGVDLARELPGDTFEALERAWLEHLVLFFRDQSLTPEQQLAFTRRFGDLVSHPFGPTHPDHPEIIVLDQVRPEGEGADEWHSDTSFIPEPPMGSMLRAVQLPASGGDTCFANMIAAYEALSPPLREMIDGLNAVHDITPNLTRASRYGDSQISLAEARAKNPPVAHPIVRTHPVTGRKALFVYDVAVTHVEGLPERESDLLLNMLYDHMYAPRFQCRFQWEPGSIALWDMRSTQHCGMPDYDERRVMHRTTLQGDRPY